MKKSENLERKVIMLKFRDEILLNSITNLFNISNVEAYKKDAETFFEITNTQILNDSNPELIISHSNSVGFNSLTEILEQFNFKVNFLYNPIYDQGLAGEINNLILEIIQNGGDTETKQNNDINSDEDNFPKSGEFKKNLKSINDFDETLNFSNFYNFFYIEIPEDFEENDIHIALSLFQTICINFKSPRKYIFDYVHLRNVTVEASPPTSTTTATATYFQSIMGFNALRTSRIVGRNGEGITIFDCETAWCGINEGFSELISFLGVNNSTDTSSIQHGTKVRSVLTSTYSPVEALCPQISFVGIAIPNKLVENAILFALIKINMGRLNGIILLEQNYKGVEIDREGNIVTVYKPVESIPSVFLAIRLAYSLKITVIEPAGNSEWDINTMNNRNLWLSSNVKSNNRLARFRGQRMNSTLTDLLNAITTNQMNSLTGNLTSRIIKNSYGKSGAIIVGGYISNTTPSDNYGDAVTCFAQGVNVPSFHYGNCTPASFTPSEFGQTSAASAIMAGMVAIMQSISLSKNSRMLTPDEVKNELKRIPPSTGTLNIPNIMSIIRIRSSKIHISGV